MFVIFCPFVDCIMSIHNSKDRRPLSLFLLLLFPLLLFFTSPSSYFHSSSSSSTLFSSSFSLVFFFFQISFSPTAQIFLKLTNILLLQLSEGSECRYSAPTFPIPILSSLLSAFPAVEDHSFLLAKELYGVSQSSQSDTQKQASQPQS